MKLTAFIISGALASIIIHQYGYGIIPLLILYSIGTMVIGSFSPYPNEEAE